MLRIYYIGTLSHLIRIYFREMTADSTVFRLTMRLINLSGLANVAAEWMREIGVSHDFLLQRRRNGCIAYSYANCVGFVIVKLVSMVDHRDQQLLSWAMMFG